MLDPEKLATIRRLYYAEQWKIGTIASELGVHRDTVRAAIETDPLDRPRRLRPSLLDPYVGFLRETLDISVFDGPLEWIGESAAPR